VDAIYRGWLFFQERIVGYAAALMMLAITIFANVEIFRRYVIGTTYHWGQDAVTFLMITAAFLFFGAAQAKRAHLAVTALPDWLRDSGREKLGLVVRIVALVLSILFVICFIYWGLPGAQRTLARGLLTESMLIPLWPFQFALLIGMGFMGVTMCFHLYRDVMRLFGHQAFAWEPDHDQLEL
jgi:TRAP-type C4-dicarboxylate transport system permease small subunit